MSKRTTSWPAAPHAPRQQGLALRELANRLTAKKHLAETGEITIRTYTDYYTTCQSVIATLGKDRLLTDLGGDDFDHLRRCLAKTRGHVALGNEINRVRILFKFGYDAGLIDRPIRYGASFRRPSKKVIRIARAKAGPRMFEANELRAILEAATLPMKAMILLGVNCGFGNTDVASLPAKALDLEAGWVRFPRPKTGIDRRCPLWPETVALLREAIASRPTPKDAKDAGLAFITKYGQGWAGSTTTARPLSAEFHKLLAKLKLHRAGLGFYASAPHHRNHRWRLPRPGGRGLHHGPFTQRYGQCLQRTHRRRPACGRDGTRQEMAIRKYEIRSGANNCQVSQPHSGQPPSGVPVGTPIAPDLVAVVEAWPTLPEATRRQVVAMVQGGKAG